MNKKILIFFLLLISPLKAGQFNSIENFSFELPKGYILLNKNNLYDVYSASNHDPSLKKQMNLFKQRLQKQKVEIILIAARHTWEPTVYEKLTIKLARMEELLNILKELRKANENN